MELNNSGDSRSQEEDHQNTEQIYQALLEEFSEKEQIIRGRQATLAVAEHRGTLIIFPILNKRICQSRYTTIPTGSNAATSRN